MSFDPATLQVPEELLARYDVAGPRYTSYPTVPTWTDGIGADAYASALRRAASSGSPMALYAHFPYCAVKCLYCGCHALTTSRASTNDRYLDDLERELDLVTAQLGRGRSTAQMHWGGGTPNLLDGRQLERAFGLFADRFTFTPDVELSVEADPRLTTREQLDTLRALGFTRISFGVQDLDHGVQVAIGRIQPLEMIADVCAWARESGFEGINLDLIYGLPRQTAESFGRTIEHVLQLAPDRVACFGYAHLPALRAHQRLINEAELPDASSRAALFHQAVTAFVAADYAWLGLDHFARRSDPLAVAQRDGRLHRNFMGYTTMPASHLVGVGMSAISEVAGCFAQSEPRLAAWRARVSAGQLPTIRGHRMSADDQARQRAILSLMCNLELALDAVPTGLGNLETRLARYVEDGLVEFQPDRLVVTPLGRCFVRNLCMEFDAYLPAQGATPRYSRTV